MTRARGRSLLLLIVLIVATGLPLALAFYTGSFGIPHNDDWSYMKIAAQFAGTGRIELLGWNRQGLIGQIVILGPLGGSIIAQKLFVAALSLVALGATYAYLLTRVGPARALLGTAIVGAVAEFGLLSTSFMSDMPAFAGMMLCMVLAERAIRSQSVVLFTVALAVGVWASTVREQAAVAPTVAVIAAFLAWRGRKRLLAGGLGLLAVATMIAFEAWRRSLPFGDPPVFAPDLYRMVPSGVRASFTMALYLSPAVFLVARPSLWRVRARVGATIALVVALVVALIRGEVFLGNYLDRHGPYHDVALGARDVLPDAMWLTLTLVACVSLALLVGMLLEIRIRRVAGEDRTSLLMGGLIVAGTLASAAAGQVTFARYLLPLVPFCAALVLRSPEPPRWRLALPGLGLVFGVSLALTASGLAFDAARWNAARTIEQSGVEPTDIDAGLEWVGYHADGPAVPSTDHPTAADWTTFFSSSRQCFLITASPLPDSRPASTHSYRTYALFGDSHLWIYELEPCR